MVNNDYYGVLGVAKSASQEEIKRAYRALARRFHPDVSKEADAEERFKEINEAYEVLSDPQKRSMYDRFGTVSPGGMGGAGYGGFRDPFDIFAEVFGNLGGFGFGSGRRPGPERGRDLHTRVDLTFEEAAFGVQKEIEIERMEVCDVCGGTGSEPGTEPQTCPDCDGRGQVRRMQQTLFGSFVNIAACPTCEGEGTVVTTPCHKCNGSGKVYLRRQLSVEIPAGVDDGMSIRLGGQGEPGERGGPRGNLYVTLHVKSHPYFKRQGNHVTLELQINIAQAALGDTVTVPTLEGQREITIPAGTQSGTVLRLRGLGFPQVRGSGRGDQLVFINVAVPKQLSPQQRDLFEELAETLGTAVVVEEKQGFVDRLKEALGL